MKVAIFTESTVWGGLEAHTVGLVGALQSAGFDPVIACIGHETVEMYRRVTAGAVPLMLVPRPRRESAIAWYRTLRAVAADAAVFQKGTLFTASFGFDVALRATFGPFIVIQQLEPPILPARSSRRRLGGVVPGVGLWWYRWRTRGYLRSLCPGVTVCVSDAVAHRLSSMYGFSPRKLTTIRHGVDLDQFRPDAAHRASARREWKVPDGAIVFGSLRRLVPEKGLDVAIDAFARTSAALPEVPMYLVIGGEGPERDALRRQVAALGLDDRVRFLGFCQRPWAVYPAIDVSLLPSRVEALGVVALEALASGCQFIGSDVGGISEMLVPDAPGTLVPPGDSQALSRAMVDAATRAPAERERLAAKGREHVARHFEIRAQYGQIASLLPHRRPTSREAAACA